MRKLAPLLLIGALLGACATPERPSTPAPDRAALYARIERMIAEEFAKDGRGGLSAGLIENGELVWTHSLGLADEEARRPASADSVYPIASATKMLTGIALLQLVERGAVHLSDPVERYVPEVRGIDNPFPWAPPITLVQLATMTSGLERGLRVRDDLKAAVREAGTWEQKMAAAVPGLRVQFEPGTSSRYSNVSYALLGLALSRAAGRPFARYVEAEILQPLGMRDSGFSMREDLGSRAVRGYALDRASAPGEAAPSSETMLLLPAAGLVSTVGDLARLMQLQLGAGPEQVLSRAALAASYQLLVPSDGNLRYGDGVGFAAVRDPDSRLTALGHGGAFVEGFVTSYEFDGARRTGVILLASTYGGRASYKVLARRILALLSPESAGGSGIAPAEEH